MAGWTSTKLAEVGGTQGEGNYKGRRLTPSTSHNRPLNAKYKNCTLRYYCNCIVTRGGVYDEISPEPEGFPDDSCHNTVILNFL